MRPSRVYTFCNLLADIIPQVCDTLIAVAFRAIEPARFDSGMTCAIMPAKQPRSYYALAEARVAHAERLAVRRFPD